MCGCAVRLMMLGVTLIKHHTGCVGVMTAGRCTLVDSGFDGGGGGAGADE